MIADFSSLQSLLYGNEVHKISKSTELTDLDLYLSDPTEPSEPAEKMPHSTMSLFQKPPTHRYPRLAAGRDTAKHKAAASTRTAARKAKDSNLPEDVLRLKETMQKANDEKEKNAYV